MSLTVSLKSSAEINRRIIRTFPDVTFPVIPPCYLLCEYEYQSSLINTLLEQGKPLSFRAAQCLCDGCCYPFVTGLCLVVPHSGFNVRCSMFNVRCFLHPANFLTTNAV
jgi:hypothetical protein